MCVCVNVFCMCLCVFSFKTGEGRSGGVFGESCSKMRTMHFIVITYSHFTVCVRVGWERGMGEGGTTL